MQQKTSGYGTIPQKSDGVYGNLSPLQKKCTIPLLVCVVILLFIVYLKITQLNEQQIEPSSTEGNQTWEFLLFTQQWPISYCSDWTEKNHLPVTSCNFATNKYAWTVHGIWPTLNDTSYPQYCRHVPFNESNIEPIEDQLNEHWSTIQKGGSTSFWKHEWLKHGTCSVQVPQLDTELKYFNQGLEWNKQYNITDALAKCSIYPDDAKLYQVTKIVDCLGQYFGVTPQIDCVHDGIRDKDILLEIRFCVDKDLNFVGCDTFGMNSICKENVIYPATVMLPDAAK